MLEKVDESFHLQLFCDTMDNEVGCPATGMKESCHRYCKYANVSLQRRYYLLINRIEISAKRRRDQLIKTIYDRFIFYHLMQLRFESY